MYSSELETLDQLQARNLPLAVIAKLYTNLEAFHKGVRGLLSCGDVLLLDGDGSAVPEWRWREIFAPGARTEQLEQYRLRITPQGARRIG